MLEHEIAIRPIRNDDFEAVGALNVSTFREYEALYSHVSWYDEYLEALRDTKTIAQFTSMLVATDSGNVVGSITIELDHEYDGTPKLPHDYAKFRMLTVAKTFRRCGIGRTLLVHAIAVVRDSGRPGVRLNTSEATGAIPLYTRLGFVRDASHDYTEEIEKNPYLGFLLEF